MTFRPSNHFKSIALRLSTVLLVGTLFAQIIPTSASAQVVQAYRRPSEADLQWLFEGQPVPIPVQSNVVQAGFLQTHCEPCEPVGLQTPPIPPAPKVFTSVPPTGITPAPESAVVQMSGRRLPPPPNLPKEKNELELQPPEPIIERLPVPQEQNVFDHSKHTAVVPNDKNLTCQPSEKRENIFSVPSMIGGSGLTDSRIRTGTDQWNLPVMLLSRPNVIEHFNAETQNRVWADYRHWTQGFSINQNGNVQHKAVEQLTFGLETKIFDGTSLELRVPLFGQFDPDQVSDTATSAELGNISVFLKQVLKRNARWTLSAGTGIALPAAKDWQLDSSRIKNRTYHLVSFLGVQWHPNRRTFGHFVVQADMSIEKNEWAVGSHVFEIEGQQMIRTGLQLGRWLYRNDSGNLPCRLGGFAEIDYAVVTDGMMPEWGLTHDKSSLTSALGLSMVFGFLTCTNSLILPLSGGDDPYSIGYNFSLSRQF